MRFSRNETKKKRSTIPFVTRRHASKIILWTQKTGHLFKLKDQLGVFGRGQAWKIMPVGARKKKSLARWLLAQGRNEDFWNDEYAFEKTKTCLKKNVTFLSPPLLFFLFPVKRSNSNFFNRSLITDAQEGGKKCFFSSLLALIFSYQNFATSLSQAHDFLKKTW
jgi:hypothetical protein